MQAGTATVDTPRPSGKSFTARASELAESAIGLGEKARHAKASIEDAFEERMRTARHAVRDGRYAAEDLMDQATLYVRRKPFQVVGSAFVGGVLLGGALLYAVTKLRRPA